MGADILAVAPRTLLITGSVEEWERWTDLRFPDSGSYVVPGALQPVVIDRNADEGRYEDPNVWMRHTIEQRIARGRARDRRGPRPRRGAPEYAGVWGAISGPRVS